MVLLSLDGLPRPLHLLLMGCSLSSLWSSSRLVPEVLPIRDGIDVDFQNRPDATKMKTRIQKVVVPLKEEDMDTQKFANSTVKMAQRPISEDFTKTIAKPPIARKCSSPERTVEWPFQGAIESSHATRTCGLQNSDTNRFTKFLSDWVQEDNSKDCDTVVYGVALGSNFVEYLNSTVLRDSKERFQHDQCFFTVVLEEDLEFIEFPDERAQVIGVPRDVLPYKNLRRNVKLFKFSGHLIFPHAKKIIWQDAKFFKNTFIWKQPQEYSSLGEGTTSDDEDKHNDKACLVASSMPLHASAFGSDMFNTPGYRPQFRDHCTTILSSLKIRPDVTDSAKNLMQQCDLYMNAVGSNDTILDDGLLDSAFLIWNYHTEECRDFNAKLQCNILDQVHCYSDRDQVSIPFAFSLMDLVADRQVDARQNDLQLVEKGNPNVPRIHMTRSACHWYFARIGQCRSSLPSVAVIVAGAARRFSMKSTLQHLLDAAEGTYRMDYFSYLTTSQSKLFRDEDYSSKLVYDPMFEDDRRAGRHFPVAMRYHLNSRNIYNQVFVHHKPASISSPLLQQKRRQAKLEYPTEDENLRFPTLNLRPEAANQTAFGNQNLLFLSNHIEMLWDQNVLPVETMLGKPYDYVFILRDDALWLDDFNLTAVASYQNNQADAYALSCDTRNPPMFPCEMTNHGILVRRQKAGIFGKYLSTMLQTDMAACHAKVRNVVGENLGCTSEMILKHIIETNNVTFQPLPSELMPVERVLNVRFSGGKRQSCFHKLCRSKEDPLVLPTNMPPCTEL